MPPKLSNAELQLKVVQRNYDSISKMMHSKQQDCEKVVTRTRSPLPKTSLDHSLWSTVGT